LLTFMVFTLLYRGLRAAIDSGNLAAAALLVGVQLAIALINAGAMAG
jgi:putative membrane protein